MKIVSLNTWGGRAGKEKLLDFFRVHKDSVDVFCLQEIWSAPYEHLESRAAGGVEIKHDDIMTYGKQEIAEVLDTYQVFFHPHHLDNYGLMMLVKKNIDVVESGDVFVYKERGHVPEGDVGYHARNIQYVTLKTEEGRKTVINFHGLWNGKGKYDSPERLVQSEKIIDFTKTLEHPFVLCGDFNLLPDTESIKKFEEAGMQNLIKEHGITSTRTGYYEKDNKFADYTFVSEGINVSKFEVLPDEVSDHAPLLLDLE